MESSRASVVVRVTLPGHHGQVDVDNLVVGAGFLLIAGSQAGVAVTEAKWQYLTERGERTYRAVLQS